MIACTRRVAGSLVAARSALSHARPSVVATPVARVALSAVAFARERDGIYVAITLVVLALLLGSLLGGSL